jgi:hypothetical protein
MANFNLSKQIWAFQDPITESQITEIAAAIMKCPNLSEGSIHSPSSSVSVGGAGIWHSNPYSLIATTNQTVFPDLNSFLYCNISGSANVTLSNNLSTGGAVPSGTSMFIVNNNTGSDLTVFQPGTIGICTIPKQTTGPSVTCMAIVMKVPGNWGMFWGSTGVLF